MKSTTCLCAGPDDETTMVGEKDGRWVGKCKYCGLVRTLAIPDDYEKLYTEGTAYHEERFGHIKYKERADHDFGIAKMRWKRHLGQVRLLDVGCANGGFLKYVSKQGVIAEGLELNPMMAEFAEAHTGCRVHTEWSTVQGFFDMITYHDVIEHVEDPIHELLNVWCYLTREGLLVLDTPDAEDPRFKALGMSWHHMKPQEHLYFYTEKTLKSILKRTGFDVEAVERPIQGKIVVYARRNR